MYAEFEEREYENGLILELVDKTSLFTPGHVFEKLIGIDAALYSKNLELWDLLDMTYFPSGDRLHPELWSRFEEKLKTKRFPKFKCNVFIQFKRPNYISRSTGREYWYWKQPYFRYNLTKHQQRTLSDLERNISSNSIVVYACASFWKSDQLYFFQEKAQLTQNSNFVKPHKLNKHHSYTFVNGGKEGKAFSEPMDVKGLNILECVNKLLKTAEPINNNADFIYSLDESIMNVVEESDEISEWLLNFCQVRFESQIINWQKA